MGEEEKKEIPGIYDIPESEEYRKGKIDKQFIKKVLLTYGSPSQVRAYEEISGIKLDEEQANEQQFFGFFIYHLCVVFDPFEVVGDKPLKIPQQKALNHYPDFDGDRHISGVFCV